jgi:putative PEP-CTERM system histidine kinase
VILSVGLLSYGLAAIGFLILTLLLAISWEGRAQGVRLIVACAVTALWASLFAVGSQFVVLSGSLVLLAEFLRYGAWFVVLTGLAASAGVARTASRTSHVAWVGCVVFLFVAPLLNRVGLQLPNPVGLLSHAGLLLSLLGLILLEQIYRNASEGGRFALKFFVIALGVMLVYDLFLYSQAQLVRGIDAATWAARGLVIVLMVPLLAISARRNPHWSLNVFVSRHVVFYTTTFMAVGAYLLLMSFGGYLIRLYGGTWGRAAQLVFFAGAGVLLLMLMASGSMRRRLRVFLNKHFYRNKYDYRVEWLRFIQTLSQPEEGIDTRDNAVRAMAQIIASPGGVLFLRDDDDGAFKVAACWPTGDFTESRRFPVLAPEEELISFLQQFEWVVDLRELRETPDAYQNIALPAFLQNASRYRLVVPLSHVEELIGFALLANPPEPFKPNYEDRDLLKTVGRHVAVHLAQFEADKRLSESRQFEAYHRLTAFVMHDLKNLAAQLSLLVSNAEKHKRNPAFVDDAISTIANSTTRMQRLIEQLQRREIQSLTRRVKLNDIARQACQRCAVRDPAPVCVGDDDEIWVDADPERLAMIVEHVIRNAQEATDQAGSVTVSVGYEGGLGEAETADTNRLRVPSAVLSVTDTGIGMSHEFVQERLFKPFDTTKGSKGMGIGAYQVREYVQSVGGKVEVHSEPGKGTCISLKLPLSTSPALSAEVYDTSPNTLGEVGGTPGEGSVVTSPGSAGEVASTAAGEGSAKNSPQPSTVAAGQGVS